MDLRIFTETDTVEKDCVIEEVTASHITILYKKLRSPREARQMIPVGDVAYYVMGGGKKEKYPDRIVMRPDRWAQEPFDRLRNVVGVEEDEYGRSLISFADSNETVTIVSPGMVSVSVREDLETAKSQPKSKKAAKAKTATRGRRKAKPKASEDEFVEDDEDEL